ncbi:Lectin-like protein BA14k [Rhizobiaceae bacterium]|nr:Lectin-like protein BA14k [Rhizobiaceae bacterium]
MRKTLSTLCATTLSASLVFGAAAPLAAGPLSAETFDGNVVRVQMDPNPMVHPETVQPDSGERVAQSDWRRDRREWRRDRRDDRRRDFHRRGDNYYFNGHRGFRHHRPGYREYNGWWFPAAAFIAGAIITGSVNQGHVVRGDSAHVRWCYDRYRSYRDWDNTFQPYNGPRRQCYSPYS